MASTIAGARRAVSAARARQSQEGDTLSTQPTFSPSAAAPGAGPGSCAACGAALAVDQRYCLECGERRPAPSDFLRAGPPGASGAPSAPPRVPPAGLVAGDAARGNPWLPVIAGIGVLLLAMGVGVLIGRAGGSNAKPGPAQVITLAGVPAGGTTSSAAGSESFTGDWPSGTKGYTVQLQTLPEGTSVSAVEQAKSAATAKGAAAVGALQESSYSSLGGSGYIIYSGVDHKKAEAEQALKTLKAKFPGAKVVEVSNKAGGKKSSEASESEASSGSSHLGKAAPPTVLEKLSHARGKNYEEQSKDLPNVVETG